MVPQKSKAKGTTERPTTKRNNSICPTPNIPEDKRDEITKKEKGKCLEIDKMKAVGDEEKRGIKEQGNNTRAVRTKQKTPNKDCRSSQGKSRSICKFYQREYCWHGDDDTNCRFAHKKPCQNHMDPRQHSLP